MTARGGPPSFALFIASVVMAAATLWIGAAGLHMPKLFIAFGFVLAAVATLVLFAHQLGEAKDRWVGRFAKKRSVVRLVRWGQTGRKQYMAVLVFVGLSGAVIGAVVCIAVYLSIADTIGKKGEATGLEAVLVESRPNANICIITIKVKNRSDTKTMRDVSVRLVSLRKQNEPSDSDVSRGLQALIGLPLMMRDDPDRPPRRSIDIHPEGGITFDVIHMQQNFLETEVQHAIMDKVQNISWSRNPSGAIPGGAYAATIEIQGQDMPPQPLSFDFENVKGKMVWRK
jgi:hypothetical protein